MKMNAEKESALKALAKRPAKMIEMIFKGSHNIHELKKVGQCSGGLIRKMVWAGIAEINDDKTIKIVKGIKKSDLPEVDPEPIKIKRARKAEEKAAKGKVNGKAKGKAKEEDEEEDERPTKKAKAGKEKVKEKAGKKK